MGRPDTTAFAELDERSLLIKKLSTTLFIEVTGPDCFVSVSDMDKVSVNDSEFREKIIGDIIKSSLEKFKGFYPLTYHSVKILFLLNKTLFNALLIVCLNANSEYLDIKKAIMFAIMKAKKKLTYLLMDKFLAIKSITE